MFASQGYKSQDHLRIFNGLHSLQQRGTQPPFSFGMGLKGWRNKDIGIVPHFLTQPHIQRQLYYDLHGKQLIFC